MLKETPYFILKINNMDVLILILMEHAQRALDDIFILKEGKCLNPYFNGTCSKSFSSLRVYAGKWS